MPALSKDVVAGHMKCLSRDIFRPVWTITPPVDLQMARGLAYEGTERDSFSGMQDYSGWTSHLARGREGGRKGGRSSLCYVRGFMPVYARYQFYWAIIRVRIS